MVKIYVSRIKNCGIEFKEDIENYTPLPSRMAHMTVIDILAVGVSKAKGPGVGDHLRKLHRGLQSLRQLSDSKS